MPQQSDWQPQTEQQPTETGWQPKTERIPVAAHTRGPKKSRLQQAAQIGVQSLPTLLGTAGEYGGAALGGLGAGTLAAPTVVGEAAAIPAGVYGGRVLGSTLGAGTGRMLANALGPAVGLEPQPLLQGVDREALMQGGLTAVGIPAFSKVRGVPIISRFSGAGNRVGQGIMELAGRVTPKGAQTMLQEGINATAGGIAKLEKKLGEAGEFTNRLYQLATRRGVRYQVADIAADAEKPLLADMAARGLRPDAPEAQQLNAFRAAWVAKHKGMLTPLELKKSIVDADGNLQAIYKRLGKPGAGVKQTLQGSDLAEERFLKSWVDFARERLRSLPDAGVKRVNGVPIRMGVKEAESHTGQMADLLHEMAPEVEKRASPLAEAIRRTGPRAGAAALGGTLGYYGTPDNRAMGALGGASAGLFLSNPWLASWIARLATDPRVQMGVGQLTRPVVSSMNQPQAQE